MTRVDRDYVRIYYVDLERDYPEVWFDPTCLSTFVRLLALADRAWPSSPLMPPAMRRADLALMESVGLLVRLSHHRYTLKGYADEREKRQAAARKGTDARWSGRNANAMQTDMQTQSKRTSVARTKPKTSPRPSTETIGASAPMAREPEDPADAYWSLTGRYPTDKVLTWIDELGAKYGALSVIRALAKSHIEDGKVATLLGRVQDRLRADARALDRAEQEAERERLREKRAIPKVVPAWEAEFRAALESKYGAVS